MSKTLKKYRVFIVLVCLNIILGVVSPDLGVESVRITKENLLEMLSVLPPIFILLGLLDVWVNRKTMMKYTGKGSGLPGVLISFLLGSAAAGPLYAAFPIAAIMLKKGCSFFNALIFVGAWSTTKIPMLTFEAANLGFPFTLVRLAFSLVGILVIAGITVWILPKEEQERIYSLNQERSES
jgi:uncharacterized membrane protein YraQ (UPF0718 family)